MTDFWCELCLFQDGSCLMLIYVGRHNVDLRYPLHSARMGAMHTYVPIFVSSENVTHTQQLAIGDHERYDGPINRFNWSLTQPIQPSFYRYVHARGDGKFHALDDGQCQTNLIDEDRRRCRRRYRRVLSAIRLQCGWKVGLLAMQL